MSRLVLLIFCGSGHHLKLIFVDDPPRSIRGQHPDINVRVFQYRYDIAEARNPLLRSRRILEPRNTFGMKLTFYKWWAREPFIEQLKYML